MIKLAGAYDGQRWDDFVLSHDCCGPYHLYAWKKAISKAYGHKAYYLVGEDQAGNIRGVLPLVYVKPPLLKGTLISAPFCDYGGILSLEDEVKIELIRHAVGLAADLKANLEIRCRDSQEELENIVKLKVMLHKQRMVIELPHGSQSLWNTFKSKLRSQIKRPQKDGLVFRLGSTELIEDFYTVFSINMRSLGSPVHSKYFIHAVLDAFGERTRVGIVYSGHIPVGAGIILMCNKTVSIPWASTMPEYNRVSPNMLLYWGFLEYACDNGFLFFDFGRSSPGEGTYMFKEQWGASPHQLYWYQHNSFTSEHPGISNGRVREMAEKAWAKLPQGLADRIGPLVRRYITL